LGYWVTKLILTPLLRLFFRVRTEGLEHVPGRGAAILASNHVSFCDSFFLPLVLPRRLTYLAKAEYFDDWKVAWFFRAVGQIPIRRGAAAEWRRSLETAVEVLGEGKLLGIYPEGTRSKDGRLHRGHTGVARVALRAGVPVIPVGIVGTREVQPVGARMLRPFRPVTIRIGRPLDFSDLAGRDDERKVLRQVTDEVMAAIQQLSGQEYAGPRGPGGVPRNQGHPSTGEHVVVDLALPTEVDVAEADVRTESA
jgi:1-acyl-sn-glycerol-3-phosphate acyltransferase